MRAIASSGGSDSSRSATSSKRPYSPSATSSAAGSRNTIRSKRSGSSPSRWVIAPAPSEVPTARVAPYAVDDRLDVGGEVGEAIVAGLGRAGMRVPAEAEPHLRAGQHRGERGQLVAGVGQPVREHGDGLAFAVDDGVQAGAVGREDLRHRRAPCERCERSTAITIDHHRQVTSGQHELVAAGTEVDVGVPQGDERAGEDHRHAREPGPPGAIASRDGPPRHQPHHVLRARTRARTRAARRPPRGPGHRPGVNGRRRASSQIATTVTSVGDQQRRPGAPPGTVPVRFAPASNRCSPVSAQTTTPTVDSSSQPVAPRNVPTWRSASAPPSRSQPATPATSAIAAVRRARAWRSIASAGATTIGQTFTSTAAASETPPARSRPREASASAERPPARPPRDRSAGR